MWKPNFDIKLALVPSNASDFDSEMDSEQIMKRIHRLYSVKEVGLIQTSYSLDLDCPVEYPKQKITVLMVGSHNLAKHKFLDLYFNESRSKGCISKVEEYDKLDKIHITHGCRKKYVTGETVLDYCPHLAELKKVPGLKDYLTTEIATKEKKSLVSFILAPEMVPKEDARVEYEAIDADNNRRRIAQLDLDTTVSTLVEAADLVFIFFDPSGTIPASELLKPFEPLWEAHHHKLNLLLAKASNSECEEKRNVALSGIVQTIWHLPYIQQSGIIPQIFVPDLTNPEWGEEKLMEIIQSAADKSVHRALAKLETDAKMLVDILEDKLKTNHVAKMKRENQESGILWVVLLGMIYIATIGLFMNKLATEENQSDDATGYNWKLVAVQGACGVVLICLAYKCDLFGRFGPILNADEEGLMQKRLLFARHALHEKTVLLEKFEAMSEKS